MVVLWWNKSKRDKNIFDFPDLSIFFFFGKILFFNIISTERKETKIENLKNYFIPLTELVLR